MTTAIATKAKRITHVRKDGALFHCLDEFTHAIGNSHSGRVLNGYMLNPGTAHTVGGIQYAEPFGRSTELAAEHFTPIS